MMSKRKVMLVLGSGATVGSNFNIDYNGTRWQPPMDRNFFEAPLVRALFTKEKYPALSWYQRSPSLEETWSVIDLHAKLAYGNVISEEEAFETCSALMRQRGNVDPSYKLKLERESSLWRLPGMAGWEIREVVCQTYGKILPPEQNQSPLETIIQALYNNANLCGIVSFNYESSVEQLLRDQFVYVLPGRSNDPSDEKIRLYKLHGSLNWKEKDLT